MNCRQAQQLLHLDRPGERTASEQSELTLHVRNCGDCRKEAETIDRTMQAMAAIRLEKLPVHESTAAVAGIISALPEQRSSFGAKIGEFIDQWNRPAVRFAYALVVLATTIGLFSQIVNFAEGPSGTDRVSPDRRRADNRPVIVYNVDAESVRSVNVSGVFPLDALTSAGTGHLRVEIRQEEVARLLGLANQYLVQTLGIPPEVKSQVEDALLRLTNEANISVRLHTSGKRQ